MFIINTMKINIARTIVMEDPFGSTVTGRTSGETVMAPKGQISVHSGNHLSGKRTEYGYIE